MFNWFRRKIEEPNLSVVEELLIDHAIESATPIKIFEDDRFRVNIFEGFNYERDIKPGRILVIEFRKSTWEAILALQEGNLNVMRNVLTEVADYLGEPLSGPVRLRTVAIGNKRFFVDDRLMQLRNVQNPNDFVDIPRGDSWSA